MIKGVDISTLLELERLKTKFYDNGAEGKLEDILASHGVNSVRMCVLLRQLCHIQLRITPV